MPARPLYVVDGAEYQNRKAGGKTLTPAFSVYSTQQPGSEPLMRVYYDQVCARGHDELEPRVERGPGDHRPE